MKHLYIVTVTTIENPVEKEMFIGFVPFRDIPKSSILFKALKKGEIAYTDGEGIEGIYWKKKYAVEHIRLEKKFRTICQQFLKYKITRI